MADESSKEPTEAELAAEAEENRQWRFRQFWREQVEGLGGAARQVDYSRLPERRPYRR
jgi:hypothetical protein